MTSAVTGREGFSAWYLLLEEARESWDYVVCDKVVYSLDPIDVALHTPIGIAKDYLDGNGWIEFHIRFKHGLTGERDAHYAAILEPRLSYDALRKHEIKDACIDRDSHVLVDVAHFIETPQEMALGGYGIPSLIRLKRFDNGQCICGYTFSPSLEEGLIAGFKDRELSIFGVGQVEFSETPNKLVESGAKVVEDVSGKQRNFVRRLLDLRNEPANPAFRIVLGAELARFGFAKEFKFLPQGIKMFFRPRCLEIGVSQAHDV